MSGALGRRVPTDFEHVEKYPLTALGDVLPRAVPVTIGVNWYTNFDSPVKVGRSYWIGRGDNLGSIRGGHCVCLLPIGKTDITPWWDAYDQGAEGACVGFGASRMMSLLNRKQYDARWLWNEAKRIDEWADTNPGDDNGTSVRAACDVLRNTGHKGKGASGPFPQEGISANRWATSVDHVLHALGTPDRDYVTMLQSWGRSYPHFTKLPCETLERLIREDGEACLVTDR